MSSRNAQELRGLVGSHDRRGLMVSKGFGRVTVSSVNGASGMEGQSSPCPNATELSPRLRRVAKNGAVFPGAGRAGR